MEILSFRVAHWKSKIKYQKKKTNAAVSFQWQNIQFSTKGSRNKIRIHIWFRGAYELRIFTRFTLKVFFGADQLHKSGFIHDYNKYSIK